MVGRVCKGEDLVLVLILELMHVDFMLIVLEVLEARDSNAREGEEILWFLK